MNVCIFFLTEQKKYSFWVPVFTELNLCCTKVFYILQQCCVKGMSINHRPNTYLYHWVFQRGWVSYWWWKSDHENLKNKNQAVLSNNGVLKKDISSNMENFESDPGNVIYNAQMTHMNKLYGGVSALGFKLNSLHLYFIFRGE